MFQPIFNNKLYSMFEDLLYYNSILKQQFFYFYSFDVSKKPLWIVYVLEYLCQSKILYHLL